MHRRSALLLGLGIGACYTAISFLIVKYFGGWELGALILTMILHPYLVLLGGILTSVSFVKLLVIDCVIGLLIALACYELNAFLLRRGVSGKKRFLLCTLFVIVIVLLPFAAPFVIYMTTPA